MPEGDTIHHAAQRIRAVLGGRAPDEIRTPHPRLRADRWPERLAGRAVTGVDAHGKHLFVRFESELVLHSHLRMTGHWGVYEHGRRWGRSPRRAWLVMRAGDSEVVEFDGPVLELLTESRTRFDQRLAALGPDILADELAEDEIVRRLRGDEDAADVDRKDAIEVRQSRLLDRRRNDRAGVVHQHVEPPEGRDRLFDGVPDCIRVGGVRLDRDRLPAPAFDLFDDGRRCVRAFGVGDGDAGAVRGQALGDRSTDATRTASHDRDLACQWSFMCGVHRIASFLCLRSEKDRQESAYQSWSYFEDDPAEGAALNQVTQRMSRFG